MLSLIAFFFGLLYLLLVGTLGYYFGLAAVFLLVSITIAVCVPLSFGAYSGTRQPGGVYPAISEFALLGIYALFSGGLVYGFFGILAAPVGVVTAPASFGGGLLIGKRYRDKEQKQVSSKQIAQTWDEPVVKEFIRVEPSDARPMPETVTNHLSSLRGIKDSFWRRYNPLKTPPKFEVLMLTHGSNNPVKFLYRAETQDKMDSLEHELKTEYPNSYDVKREYINLSKELLPDEIYKLRYGETESDTDILSAGDTYTEESGYLTPDEFQGVEPYGVHWYGKEERRGDWQTFSKRYTKVTKRQRQKEDTERRRRPAPLATIIDNMAEVNHPIAMQVVFHRRRSWEFKATRRKSRIKKGIDTPGGIVAAGLGALVMAVLGDPENQQDEDLSKDIEQGSGATEDVDETGEDQGSRFDQIDDNGTKETWKVNMRCLGFVPEGTSEDDKDELLKELDTISDAFNHLQGKFYRPAGRVVKDGIRERHGKRPTREELLEDFINREIRTTLFSKTRLQLLFNKEELANYVAVPGSDALTEAGRRAVRRSQTSRSPLELPYPEQLKFYQQEGIEIGYPLDKHGDPLDEPARVPPSLLNEHYIRAASTGSGKSVSVESEVLSFNEYTKGPNILIEPKGGDMVKNYLQAHYWRFGTLEDVVWFNIPEDLPAMPFFDIRPLLSAGMSRTDAINDKVEQFDDIMEVIMGSEDYKESPNSNKLIRYLIKAKFDHKTGSDAFTLKELQETLATVATEMKTPHISEENDHLRTQINTMMEGGDGQMFSNIAKGANLRLGTFAESEYLRQMWNHVPEWSDGSDGEPPGYVDNGFNLFEFIRSNKTIILDVGKLPDRDAKLLSLVFTGYVWQAMQIETKHGGSHAHSDVDINSEEYIASCILEESRDLADSSLVNQLLDVGREFGLCVGLIMQYPGQMDDASSDENIYEGLIQNVGTKILGETQLAHDFAEVLSHDEITDEEFRTRLSRLPDGEWVVQLKEPDHFHEKPLPFSVHSMEHPPGHDKSNNPLEGDKLREFKKQKRKLQRRMEENYCIPEDERVKRDGSDEETIGASDLGSLSDMEQPGETEAARKTPVGSTATRDVENQTVSGESNEESMRTSSGEQTTTSAGKEAADSSSSAWGENHGPLGEKVEEPEQETVHANGGVSETTQSNSSEAAEQSSDSSSFIDDVNLSAENAGMEGERDEIQQASPSSQFDETVSDGSGGSHIGEDERSVEQVTKNTVNEPFGQSDPENEVQKKLGELDVDELEDRELSEDDVEFLINLLQALRDQHDEYSIDQPMTKVPGYEDANVELLEERGYIERVLIGRMYHYFNITKKTTDWLDEQLPKGEHGDLGEKTIHRVGCYLTMQIFEQTDGIAEAEWYAKYNEHKYDVLGCDEKGEPVCVAEIETGSNNYDSIVDDYEKMAECPGQRYWVVDKKDTAETIIRVLQDRKGVYTELSDSWVTYQDLRTELEQVEGQKQFYGISELFKLVNSNE
jgi:hypothetical protein